MTLTFGSLFSGIGGIDLGLTRAGLQCSWQVEIDSYCGRVLEHHWPDTIRFGDIRECGAANLVPVDVLAGGFPCQNLSVAGHRAGLAGEQSGLFYEFARIADELRPRWLVIENVTGLLSSNGGRDMGAVLGTLGELGYGYAYRVLDAQYFGVPQRRRRVFVVGHLGEPWSAPAEVLFEPESCNGDTPPSREARQEVAGTLGGGSGERGWPTDMMTFVPEVSHCLTAESNRHTGTDWSRTYVPEVSHALMAGGDKADTTRMTYVPDTASGLQARSGEGVDSTGTGMPLVTHTLTSEGADASEDGSGRGTPLIVGGGLHGEISGFVDDISSAVTGGNGQPPAIAVRTAHTAANGIGVAEELAYTLDGAQQAVSSDAQVRRLTPLECERLMGLPDGWTAGQADSPRYKQCGNAVVSNVAEWIGRRIVGLDKSAYA